MFEFIDVKYKDILVIKYLYIKEKRITTITGQSGSGKTTILKMLNKIISPTSGTIYFKKTDLLQVNSIEHRKNVVMLSQTPAVFEGNIRDNLNIGLKFRQKMPADDDLLEKTLEKVNLKKPLDSPAEILSGGEKQRLALARIMLLDSEVYLLDEPSSALDDDTAAVIIKMITEYVSDQEKSLVMVTHSNTIADKYSEDIIHINSDGSSDGT